MLALLTSCETHPLLIRGDNASIELVGKDTVYGELLLLQDSTIYVGAETPASIGEPKLSPYEYYRIPFAKIAKITMEGFVNHGWRWLVGEQALGATLLFVAAATTGVGDLAVGLIFFIPPLLDWGIFSASEPNEPSIAFPLNDPTHAELKKYVRLPQDLDSSQIRTFFNQLGNPKEHIIH